MTSKMYYNIGDLVWTISLGEIRQGSVVERSYWESTTGHKEDYTIQFNANTAYSFPVHEVFNTLEELVNKKTIPYES